ncbi:hypothetical protein HRN19_004206 [Salmonella enterica]|nr:hypothetical protein [Salmonella enterica]
MTSSTSSSGFYRKSIDMSNNVSWLASTSECREAAWRRQQVVNMSLWVSGAVTRRSRLIDRRSLLTPRPAKP